MKQRLNSAMPGAISQKLRLVRQRKMIVHVATAVVAALAVLLAAMGVAMLIDWLATLYDSRWRVVLTLAAFLAAGADHVRLAGGGVAARAAVGTRWPATSIAQFPNLEERWTTMTRLRPEDAANPAAHSPGDAAPRGGRGGQLGAARRAGTGRVAFDADADDALPDGGHGRAGRWRSCSTRGRRWCWCSGSGCRARRSRRRSWSMCRATSSSAAASRCARREGEGHAGRAGHAVPARSAKTTTRTITLVAHGQEPIEFSHRVRAVEEPFAYRFRAGDGQTDWYNVDVADRPEIDKLQLTVTPPAYTSREAKTFDKLPQRVSAIEKSELELALRPDRPVETRRAEAG